MSRAPDRCSRGQDRRAISGPLTPVTSGLSRSLTDSPSCRSGRIAARTAQIPKLIPRVLFQSLFQRPLPWLGLIARNL